MPFFQVDRIDAGRRLALRVHLLDAAAVDEVVNVRRTERDRQDVVNVGQVHLHRADFFGVDVDFVLRFVRKSVRERDRELAALHHRAEELALNRVELVVSDRRLVLQEEFQTGSRSKLHNRRRNDRRDLRFVEAGERAHQAVANGVNVLPFPLTLVERLQTDEADRGVRVHPGEAKAGNFEDRVNRVRLVGEEVIGNLRDDFFGAFLARAFRELRLNEERPLVFVREERRRHLRIQPRDRDDDQDEENHKAQTTANDVTDRTTVTGGASVEPEVERFKEPTEQQAEQVETLFAVRF